VRLLFGCLLLLVSGCRSRPDRLHPQPKPTTVPSAQERQPSRPRITRNTVRPGETLLTLLTHAGLPERQSLVAIEEISKHMDPDRIRAGRAYSTHRDQRGSLTAFVYHQSPLQDLVLSIGEPPTARLRRQQPETVIRHLQATVRHSLHRAIVSKGHPTTLAVALTQLFEPHIDFERIPPGSRFQVLYRELRVGEQTIGIDQIVGARIDDRRTVHQAFFFQSEGRRGYYDETGRPIGGGFLPSPVATYPISSPFSPNRFHPILKRNMPHLGTDYAAPHGSPVMAVADGRISEARYGKYNGYYVKIRHDRVYETQYLHLSQIAEDMTPGRDVKRGETIGYVGDTGLADGAHLCFRFWKQGRQVDPAAHRGTVMGEPAGPGFERAAQAIARRLGPLPERPVMRARDQPTEHRTRRGR